MVRYIVFALISGALMVAMAPAHADPAPADVERQLASAWQELEVVIERFNAARDELRAINARRAAIENELVPLRQAVEAAQARASELSAALYRGGQIGGIGALLSSPSPGTLMDQLAALDHLERSRHREFARLADGRSELERQERELAALSAQQRTQQLDLLAHRAAIEAQIQRLGGRAGRGAARSPWGALNDGFVPVFTADAAGTAVRFAYSQLGKVYRFAAEGPDAYDCSGLVMASWRAAGVSLPHNAARQYKTVRPITRAELKQGDLVFYYRDVHHVALYIGADRVIDAPRPGERISMRLIDFAPIVGYGRLPY